SVLECTFVAHIVRPFTSRRSTEIIAAPKVYAFDTGFVSYYRGWQTLDKQDLGYLWEHYVLNEMQARLSKKYIFYWRDKRGHEIDFVFAQPGKAPITIECKWQVSAFDSTNLEAFRRQYEKGENLVVCPDVSRSINRHYKNMPVKFVSLENLIAE